MSLQIIITLIYVVNTLLVTWLSYRITKNKSDVPTLFATMGFVFSLLFPLGWMYVIGLLFYKDLTRKDNAETNV